MKLTNWLKKIWKSIKSLFNRISPDIKEAIHLGVVVTENMKIFVDSPAADILTVLIPGDTDDKIKVALRSALPALLLQLKLADNCMGASTAAEITTCAVKTLQSLADNVKSALLHNLAVMIAEVAADGKLSWKEGASVMEWYYQQNFKVMVK
jgi:hypothetical protein